MFAPRAAVAPLPSKYATRRHHRRLSDAARPPPTEVPFPTVDQRSSCRSSPPRSAPLSARQEQRNFTRPLHPLHLSKAFSGSEGVAPAVSIHRRTWCTKPMPIDQPARRNRRTTASERADARSRMPIAPPRATVTAGHPDDTPCHGTVHARLGSGEMRTVMLRRSASHPRSASS